jgi:hypothetical protein
MPIEPPKSDLARSVQHEQNQDWPHMVKIQLVWLDKNERPLVKTRYISSDEFFGRKQYGAPMSGESIIQEIERMRRDGPPIELKRSPKKKT